MVCCVDVCYYVDVLDFLLLVVGYFWVVGYGNIGVGVEQINWVYFFFCVVDQCFDVGFVGYVYFVVDVVDYFGGGFGVVVIQIYVNNFFGVGFGECLC